MNKIFNKQLIKQICLIVSVTVFSISFGAFASTVIDSTGITTNNLLTEGFKVHTTYTTDGSQDAITVDDDDNSQCKGCVGIGTSTPQSKLHIYKGNLEFSDELAASIVLGNDMQQLDIRSNKNDIATGSIDSSFVFRPGEGFKQNVRSRNTDEEMNGYHWTDIFSFPAYLSEDAFILNNLGIGTTTTESAKLKVQGESIFDGRSTFNENILLGGALFPSIQLDDDVQALKIQSDTGILSIGNSQADYEFWMTPGDGFVQSSRTRIDNDTYVRNPVVSFPATTTLNAFILHNIGIATTTPRATLDVNGFMRLKVNSAQPVACSATNDGAIALNSNYELCTCKGATGWVKTASSTQACAW